MIYIIYCISNKKIISIIQYPIGIGLLWNSVVDIKKVSPKQDLLKSYKLKMKIAIVTGASSGL